MSNEKLKILEMVEQGKITATEGMELLKVIDDTDQSSGGAGEMSNRFLRVRVEGDKIAKVNVNIPLSLIRSAAKLVNIAMGFVPPEAKAEMERKGINLAELDLNEIVAAIQEGASDGKLVDVDVDDDHEGRIKVEVFVD